MLTILCTIFLKKGLPTYIYLIFVTWTNNVTKFGQLWQVSHPRN